MAIFTSKLLVYQRVTIQQGLWPLLNVAILSSRGTLSADRGRYPPRLAWAAQLTATFLLKNLTPPVNGKILQVRPERILPNDMCLPPEIHGNPQIKLDGKTMEQTGGFS